MKSEFQMYVCVYEGVVIYTYSVNKCSNMIFWSQFCIRNTKAEPKFYVRY